MTQPESQQVVRAIINGNSPDYVLLAGSYFMAVTWMNTVKV